MAERNSTDPAPNTPPPSGGVGAKAFLPLLAAVLVMPAVSWVLTSFVLVPKLQKSLGAAPSQAAHAPAEPEAKHGEAAAAKDHGAKEHGAKEGAAQGSVTLSRLLVNVSGTMGSRYLQASLTLSGSTPDFRTKIERNEARLRDMACTALAAKTISDLEKPGARNLVRSELLNGFNRILGGNTVEELFITEFAIQ